MAKGKGWYGQKQQHSMASKGIKSIIYDEKSGVWFESQGIFADVITLLDGGMGKMLSNGVRKDESNGYSQEEYVGDASNVVLLPSSKAVESIEWIETEYTMARTSQRKAQLERLVKMTLNRIRLELGKENPRYVDGQLKESYRLYTGLLDDIKGKQRRKLT